ncbi:phage tail spike protein [Bifidobacterium callitrichos]|uniref:Tail protein n=1 Tax=Bifidobacterium callitrichos DSM 23973 TaxID=1437609 RepID=A0A087ACU7_9BIFI|nr:phage tail spike protein [Bifidobacterium callitrichos]KFI56597.1 tail protein [Bifidobacterium callitrichos DSM 23973]
MLFHHYDGRNRPASNLTVLSAVRTQATDGSDSLDLTVIGDIQRNDIILYQDAGTWHETICASVKSTRAEGMPVTVARLVPSMRELDDSVYLTGWDPENITPQAMLERILSGSRWQAGHIDEPSLATSASFEFEHASGLEALQQLTDTFGYEIDQHVTLDPGHTTVTGRYVDLHRHRGGDTGKRFTYGKDLTEVERVVGDHPVITRLYAYGKEIDTTTGSGDEQTTRSKLTIESVNNGKPYLDADRSVQEAFGVPGPDGTPQPRIGYVEDTDIDDPNQLLAYAQAQLAQRTVPQITYTASVAVMGLTGVGVGDTVQIVDTSWPEPLRLSGRILKLKRDLMGGADDAEITLGSIIPSLSRHQSQVEADVQKIWNSKGSWDAAANVDSSWLDGVINGLNTLMNQTGGYTYLVPNEGIYVYDKPKDQNPTQVIQIGGGYYRVANSRKSDGTWDWRTMATGSGLVADLIYTGTIKGRNLTINLSTGEVNFQGGRISDDQGHYWDLNSGTMDLGTGEIRIDGTMAGHSFTTIIDGSGFRITEGGSEVGGLMIDDQGELALRGVTLGNSDNDYIQNNNNSIDMYSNGSKLFSIEGSASSYNGWLNMICANYSPFLFTGDKGGYPNSTIIYPGNGDTGSSIVLEPNAINLQQSSAGLTLSTDGWAGVYGLELSYGSTNRLDMKDGSTNLIHDSDSRVDLAGSYAALVYGNNHVQVTGSGIGFTPSISNASLTMQNRLDTQLTTLADNGVDLDQPDIAYNQLPISVTEIDIPTIHDALRALADGDTATAKQLLDEFEANAPTLSQSDLDKMNIPRPDPSLSHTLAFRS